MPMLRTMLVRKRKKTFFANTEAVFQQMSELCLVISS